MQVSSRTLQLLLSPLFTCLQLAALQVSCLIFFSYLILMSVCSLAVKGKHIKVWKFGNRCTVLALWAKIIVKTFLHKYREIFSKFTPKWSWLHLWNQLWQSSGYRCVLNVIGSSGVKTDLIAIFQVWTPLRTLMQKVLKCQLQSRVPHDMMKDCSTV